MGGDRPICHQHDTRYPRNASDVAFIDYQFPRLFLDDKLALEAGSDVGPISVVDMLTN